MPDSTDEDRWARLAAELNQDTPPPLPNAAAAPAGEGPPKRRRRRRSRKPDVGEVENGAPMDAAVTDEPMETGESDGDNELAADGTPKKRRRRRSRRKLGDEVGAPNGVAGAVAIADAGDNDDEAAEPVSVANLPSWQELIDGLHRP
jgi:hypothetical protein